MEGWGTGMGAEGIVERHLEKSYQKGLDEMSGS